MMAHYGLGTLGLDTGTMPTPSNSMSLATASPTIPGGSPVVTAAGFSIQSPFGGANVTGRISASMLAVGVVGLVLFYVKTRGIQL